MTQEVNWTVTKQQLNNNWTTIEHQLNNNSLYIVDLLSPDLMVGSDIANHTFFCPSIIHSWMMWCDIDPTVCIQQSSNGWQQYRIGNLRNTYPPSMFLSLGNNHFSISNFHISTYPSIPNILLILPECIWTSNPIFSFYEQSISIPYLFHWIRLNYSANLFSTYEN